MTNESQLSRLRAVNSEDDVCTEEIIKVKDFKIKQDYFLCLLWHGKRVDVFAVPVWPLS